MRTRRIQQCRVIGTREKKLSSVQKIHCLFKMVILSNQEKEMIKTI